MKLLALMGTPRKKGNGVRILEHLEASLGRMGDVSLEYLFLGDLDLPYCRGCKLCITRSEQLCPHKAITLPLRDRVLTYDGFIFYSPVYAHGITALTKNFVDHMAYLFHRPIMVDRPALVVTTTDGSGIKETLDYLKFTAVGFGCHYVGGLGIRAFLMELDARYREKTLCELDALGKQLHRAVVTGQRRAPRLDELMFFRAMRSKAQFIKADQEYWRERGWMRQNYFVDRPLNPIANGIAALSETITRWYIQSYARKMGYKDTSQLMAK